MGLLPSMQCHAKGWWGAWWPSRHRLAGRASGGLCGVESPSCSVPRSRLALLLTGQCRGKAAAELELPQPVFCALLPSPLRSQTDRQVESCPYLPHCFLLEQEIGAFPPCASEDVQTPSFPMSWIALESIPVRLNYMNANSPQGAQPVMFFKHVSNNL